MTSHERFARMYKHQEADRVPVLDSPWSTTIERWRREGMPDGAHWTEFFGLDAYWHFGVDNSPRYPVKVLEETPEYTITTTVWGVTLKNWKHIASTPDFVDFTVKDRPSWADAKARMTPDPARIDWAELDRRYKKAKAEDAWCELGLWFGFDTAHSWMVGTERLLIALMDDPEWCADIFEHMLDVNLKLLDLVLAKGYRFDAVNWPDDLGYKGTQFFSKQMYKDLEKPYHARACAWAHERGMYTRLHSCGMVEPLVPEFIDAGIDMLNPLEVKAGMDPVALKDKYGDKLAFHGGVNAVLWDKPDQIRAEIERVVPHMKKGGGYVFASDHSIPDNVSLEDFRGIIECVKKAGAY